MPQEKTAAHFSQDLLGIGYDTKLDLTVALSVGIRRE